jgi:tetratricopeptide (TPR) repeat protein
VLPPSLSPKAYVSSPPTSDNNVNNSTNSNECSAKDGKVEDEGEGADVSPDKISPLMQALQLEIARENTSDRLVDDRIGRVYKLMQANDIEKVKAMVPTILPDLAGVTDSNVCVRVAKAAAILLNGGHTAIALTLLEHLFPAVRNCCAAKRDVMLPIMDLFGKAYAFCGKVHAALPILEEYATLCYEDGDPSSLDSALQQTLQLMVQLYGSTQQFDKAIALYTTQFEFYRKHLGDASEPAIAALNSRAKYHFSTKQQERAMEDHREVVRLMGVLKGESNQEVQVTRNEYIALYEAVGLSFVVAESSACAPATAHENEKSL